MFLVTVVAQMSAIAPPIDPNRSPISCSIKKLKIIAT